MTNPAKEAFGQARQGSVAAIIQVLNERLADIGIRTRAVVAEGMLQLLCEAATPEQLEKTVVVDRVRAELETISPQRIKRVKINSRIVKEEQLLWLEEINKDPENALLWAEVITLKRPFFIQRWIRDRNLKPAGPIFKDITEPEPTTSSVSTKLLGAGGLALLLLGAGWVFRDDITRLTQPVTTLPTPEAETASSTPQALAPESSAAGGDRTADITPQAPPPSAEAITQAPTTPPAPSAVPTAPTATESKPAEQTTTEQTSTEQAPATPASTETAAPAATPAPKPASPSTPAASQPPTSNSGAVADVFAEAVRVAEQAGVDGQTASTAAEWLDLAARWQRASDLMGEVPEGSAQYAIAQDRLASYKTNSEAALTRAGAAQ